MASYASTQMQPFTKKNNLLTYKNHFDDEIFLIGTLESVIFCKRKTEEEYYHIQLIFRKPQCSKYDLNMISNRAVTAFSFACIMDTNFGH